MSTFRKSKSASQGFTLIELMIVVAIVSILAALAIPAYQDYVARAQTSEGLALASAGKVAMSTYYGDHGRYPANNAEAGMASPSSIYGENVRSVYVDNTGTITITFSSSASGKISGQTMTIQATDHSGSLTWVCAGLASNYLPSSCR